MDQLQRSRGKRARPGHVTNKAYCVHRAQKWEGNQVWDYEEIMRSHADLDKKMCLLSIGKLGS